MTLSISSLWGISKHGVLEEILGRYTRDVTILEIGERSRGFAVCQIAGCYPDSVFIIMGKDQADFVEEIREKDFANNLIWLNRLPTSENIQTLSLSEHFDIIILNYLNYISHEEWEKLALLCQEMSHHVIINPRDEEGKSPEILENHLPFSLIKRTCIHPRTIRRSFTLHFDYDRISLIKVKPPYVDQWTTWKPGINLITFLVFNGHYPDRSSILLNLPLDFEHRDWMPNNMIIQGKNIELIDKGDPANEPGGTGGCRLCKNELIHTKQLILESWDKTAEVVKKIFCSIYKVEGLLQIEEAD